MAPKDRTGSAQRLFAAMLGICFVLKLSLVPIHLALADHFAFHGHSEEVHGEPTRPGSSEDASAALDEDEESHEPHSADEHLEHLADLFVPAGKDLLSKGLLPAESLCVAAPCSPSVRQLREERSPRPPPQRDAPKPRGPPVLT